MQGVGEPWCAVGPWHPKRGFTLPPGAKDSKSRRSGRRAGRFKLPRHRQCQQLSTSRSNNCYAVIRCRRWLPTLLDDCSLVISLFRRFGLGAGAPRPLQDGRRAAAPALPDSRLLVGDRPGPVCDPDARVLGRVRVALAVGESWQDPREGDRGLELAADALVSAGPRAVDDRYRPGCRAVGRARHGVDAGN